MIKRRKVRVRKITGIETKNSTLTDEEVAVLDSRGYNPALVRGYIDILKQYKPDYDESKSLWENMYYCIKPGCIMRTIHKSLYDKHIEADMHIYDRRKGLVESRLPKLRVIEEIDQ